MLAIGEGCTEGRRARPLVCLASFAWTYPAFFAACRTMCLGAGGGINHLQIRNNNKTLEITSATVAVPLS